jgi:type IV pilus assembly protein PilV
MKNSSKQQSGATLIEVLVSMLIIMLGILGAMGLKVASAKAAAESNLRSSAAMYAQDMFERVRANPNRANNNEYNVNIGDALVTPATTIAQADLLEWYQRLDANLPSGTATISVLASQATVTIQWLERSTANSTGQTVTFSFSSLL